MLRKRIMITLLVLGLLAPSSVYAEPTESSESVMEEDTAERYSITGFCDERVFSLKTDNRSLDEIIQQMPSSLKVILNDAEEVTEIPVSWSCSDDFENTQYDLYTFNPQWDTNVYPLSDSIQTTEIPYGEVAVSENKKEDEEELKKLSHQGILQEGHLDLQYYELSSEIETAIIMALEQRQDIIELGTFQIPEADINKVVQEVLNNNPRFYYVSFDEYGCKEETVSSLYPIYRENIESRAVNEYEAAVAVAMSGIEENMSQMEKALYIHDYLVQICAYDYERLLNNTMPIDSYTAYGVLVNHTAVCQGYAEAYLDIMKRLGFPCIVVASDEMNHAWNMIQIDGEWYHVDATWDDPVWDSLGLVRHEYFLLSDNAITALEHYGWREQYSTEVSVTADSTRYDQYFWKGVNTRFFYKKGFWYYCNSIGEISRKVNVSDKQATVIKNLGLWQGYYAKLIVDDKGIYYNVPDAIYYMDYNGKNVKTIFTLADKTKEIYGLGIVNNAYYYVVKKEPNEEGPETYLRLDISGNVPEATGIKLNVDSKEMKVSDGDILTAQVFPIEANQKVVWKSSVPSVVSVDDNGHIKALKKGTANITAATENGKFQATCIITVKQPVTGIETEEYSKEINVGETVRLKYRIIPADADNTAVIWKTNNQDVAEVSQEGAVTGKTPGEARISAITKDGDFEAQYIITVKEEINAEEKGRGDVDGDGKIGIRDALLILHDISGTQPLTESRKKAADVDGDGRVTVRDAMRLLHFISGSISNL